MKPLLINMFGRGQRELHVQTIIIYKKNFIYNRNVIWGLVIVDYECFAEDCFHLLAT